MKEDILEQIVEDYLQTKGYFTRRNIKYLPNKEHKDYIKSKDSNHSDIDVLGFNPTLSGCERVIAVSCKSYQTGFGIKRYLGEVNNPQKKAGKKEPWKFFRELVIPKWSDAFVSAVKAASGTDTFTYVAAFTKLKGKKRDLEGAKKEWENNKQFLNAMHDNPIRILTLTEMVSEIAQTLTKNTLASSDLGRTIQLLKASGYSLMKTLTFFMAIILSFSPITHSQDFPYTLDKNGVVRDKHHDIIGYFEDDYGTHVGWTVKDYKKSRLGEVTHDGASYLGFYVNGKLKLGEALGVSGSSIYPSAIIGYPKGVFTVLGHVASNGIVTKFVGFSKADNGIITELFGDTIGYIKEIKSKMSTIMLLGISIVPKKNLEQHFYS
jgi:hypothetical protein